MGATSICVPYSVVTDCVNEKFNFTPATTSKLFSNAVLDTTLYSEEMKHDAVVCPLSCAFTHCEVVLLNLQTISFVGSKYGRELLNTYLTVV